MGSSFSVKGFAGGRRVFGSNRVVSITGSISSESFGDGRGRSSSVGEDSCGC